ncbi:MAG: hypothetical protein M3177_08450 [Pseudomonadota bacterium]|nr:hypothetical protein [Pseudomonadota bacterium]
MQKTHLLAAAIGAATLALAACGEPQVVTVNKYDPQAEALKNAAPVAPPPMITANRTYRCRDNSLYYVAFLNNNTANIRTNPTEGVPTVLTSEDADGPYTGEGYNVSGNGETVTINGKSCRT